MRKFRNLFKKKIKVVTHDGNFHADDIFAVAVLNLVYEGNIKVIRSRDSKIVEQGDIVLDIGQVYDPQSNRYDHHQSGGAGVRENNFPYAAFGLIWKHYGKQLVDSDEVHEVIDEELVQQIDAADTGHCDFYSSELESSIWVPDKVFKSFNTNSKDNSKDSYENFMYLVDFASKFLKKLIKKSNKKVIGWKMVEEDYQNSKDKRIVILREGVNWHRPLVSKPEPLYVIFPDSYNTDYRILGVLVKEGSYQTRKPFPENWRGKEDKDLQEATGITGAKFCHNAGFMMVVDSLENAILLARLAANAK